MAKPRHGNLMKELADEFSINLVSDVEADAIVAKKTLSKKGNLGKAEKEYNKKLAGECFDKFTYKDWLKYFYQGYKRLNGVDCFIPKTQIDRSKHKAVMESIMKATTPLELKTIIDFLFSQEQTFKLRKENISVYDLMEKNHAKLKIQSRQWKDGTYKSNDQLFENRGWKKSLPKRTREWNKGTQVTDDAIID